MSDEHPKFPGFKEAGHLDVDAGSIWLGDGCYVLKDKDEQRPKDLGDDWHGICERFFNRSGYHEANSEFRDWHRGHTDEWMASAERKALLDEIPARPADYDRERDKDTPYAVWFRKIHDAEKAFKKKWQEEHPFEPTVVDTGVAQFNHDLGHGGMGMMVSTYYGDGTYPVYIEYGEGGRPRRVLIDFDPGADEEEEELLEAAE